MHGYSCEVSTGSHAVRSYMYLLVLVHIAGVVYKYIAIRLRMYRWYLLARSNMHTSRYMRTCLQRIAIASSSYPCMRIRYSCEASCAHAGGVKIKSYGQELWQSSGCIIHVRS